MDEFNVNQLLDDISKLQPAWLAQIVELLEATELGQLAVQKNPNRKLYAVLRATPDEYLQRLGALLEFADEQTSMMWQATIRLSLPIIKFSDYIDRCCENGQISRVAADDMTKRLWKEDWFEMTSVFM